MEESKAEAVSAGWRGDAARLALLVLLGVGLHVWMIGHTAVVARDSIGYIRYAMLLEQLPWTEAIRKMEQHPLYPAYLLAVSVPVRALAGGTTAAAMSLSCQIASSLAAVLLVFPMYYLGRALFDRRTGFWGAMLFQCLPICVQVTSDGLSDALFLLLTTTGLCFAVVAMQRRSGWAFLLAGLATGLAYLTRPEGALVAVAALLVLGAVQWRPQLRWTWRQGLTGAASLLTGAAVVALPYMAVVGGLSNKPTAKKLLAPQVQDDAPRPAWQTSASETIPLATAPLAIWWIDQNREGAPPPLWVAKTLAAETLHAFHYFAWLPALLGLWWHRERLRTDPGMWVVLVLCGMLLVILFRVLTVVQYLSERHTLLLVLAACIWAAAGLGCIVDRLNARWVAPRWQRAFALACFVMATAWCLPAGLKPLHANRAGHRAAGEWLAANVHGPVKVVDPFCWAQFYSGQEFRGERSAPGAPSRKYVVVTESRNTHARLSGFPDARKLAEQGAEVYRWTPNAYEERRYRAETVKVVALP